MDKEDQLLKSSLLNDIAENIKSLQGKSIIAIDGFQASDAYLIDESIAELVDLRRLIQEKAVRSSQDPTQVATND